MTDALASWLGRTSVDVAVLVAVVAVVLAIFGRTLGPRWRHALWAVVVLRLCVPVLPALRPSTTDLPRALAEPAAAVLVRRRAARPEPVARSTSVAADDAREAPAVDGAPSETAHERPDERADVAAGLATVGPVEDGSAALDGSGRRTPRAAPTVALAPPRRAPTSFPWRGALVLGWLAGVALSLGVAARRERAFRVALRTARPVEDPSVRALLERCAGSMGTRAPELLETDTVSAPALCGLRRPTLLVPEDATVTLSRDELELVLLHELAHLRHRDVAWNLLLVVLRAVWWFHPFARLALREFSRAQEHVRDREALVVAGRDRAASYARTLVKLVRAVPPRLRSPRAVGFLHGRSLERRIQMIVDLERPSHRWLGATLLVGVAGLGLTSAAGEPAPRPQGDDGLLHVQVDRPVPPIWRARMLERLSEPIEVDVEGVEVEAFVDVLRERTGSNFVLLESGREQALDEGLELTIRHSGSALDVLGALYDAADYLDWSLEEDIVVLGPTSELPNAHEVAFYAIGPLVAAAAADEFAVDDAQFDGNALVDRVLRFTGAEDSCDWDLEGTWIECWGDVLVVSQTPRMQAEVAGFLDLLQNGGRTAESVTPAWERELRTALAQRGSVRFEDLAVDQALAHFEALSGVPVHVSQEWSDEHGDGEVSLVLADVPYLRILDWLAAALRARVRFANGGVQLVGRPPVEVRAYPIASLLEAMTAGDEDDDRWNYSRMRLEELLRNRVEPEVWDEEPAAAIEFWVDLLVVAQTPEGHAQIGPMLESLERAFRR